MNLILLFVFHQVSSSVWMNAADRTKSINLDLLEEMFQIEEKEKALNPGEYICMTNLNLPLTKMATCQRNSCLMPISMRCCVQTENGRK